MFSNNPVRFIAIFLFIAASVSAYAEDSGSTQVKPKSIEPRPPREAPPEKTELKPVSDPVTAPLKPVSDNSDSDVVTITWKSTGNKLWFYQNGMHSWDVREIPEYQEKNPPANANTYKFQLFCTKVSESGFYTYQTTGTANGDKTIITGSFTYPMLELKNSTGCNVTVLASCETIIENGLPVLCTNKALWDPYATYYEEELTDKLNPHTLGKWFKNTTVIAVGTFSMSFPDQKLIGEPGHIVTDQKVYPAVYIKIPK